MKSSSLPPGIPVQLKTDNFWIFHLMLLFAHRISSEQNPFEKSYVRGSNCWVMQTDRQVNIVSLKKKKELFPEKVHDT